MCFNLVAMNFHLGLFLGAALCLGWSFSPVPAAFSPSSFPARLPSPRARVRADRCVPVRLCVMSCGRVCWSHARNRLSLRQPGSRTPALVTSLGTVGNQTGHKASAWASAEKLEDQDMGHTAGWVAELGVDTRLSGSHGKLS